MEAGALLDEVIRDISQLMPYEDFVRIMRSLRRLKSEEEQKLLALADLQKAYLNANNDFEKEYVRDMVSKIRELSKTARTEIRSLNLELTKHMTLDQANALYDRLIEIQTAIGENSSSDSE